MHGLNRRAARYDHVWAGSSTPQVGALAVSWGLFRAFAGLGLQVVKHLCSALHTQRPHQRPLTSAPIQSTAESSHC